jgi:hypothetical protein
MSQLLPGESFPRAEIRPVSEENPPRAAKPRGVGRRSFAPRPHAAPVETRFSFPTPRSGISADHGAPCSRGASRCGVARLGKRPVT